MYSNISMLKAFAWTHLRVYSRLSLIWVDHQSRIHPRIPKHWSICSIHIRRSTKSIRLTQLKMNSLARRWNCASSTTITNWATSRWKCWQRSTTSAAPGGHLHWTAQAAHPRFWQIWWYTLWMCLTTSCTMNVLNRLTSWGGSKHLNSMLYHIVTWNTAGCVKPKRILPTRKRVLVIKAPI